jgi:hypothetical protein
MTEKLVALWIRATLGLRERDAGQGTLEYVGMIIVAAILAVAVLTVATDADLGQFFSDQITRITDFAP